MAYEAGLKTSGPRYSRNIAGFYYDYRDLQVEFFTGGTGAIPLNAASASIYGIDIDGSVKVTKDFTWRIAGSYLPRARYDSYPAAIAYILPLTPAGLTIDNSYDATGSRLIKTPKLTLSTTGTYAHELDAGQLEASLTAYHASSIIYDVTGWQARSLWQEPDQPQLFFQRPIVRHSQHDPVRASARDWCFDQLQLLMLFIG